MAAKSGSLEEVQRGREGRAPKVRPMRSATKPKIYAVNPKPGV